MASLLKLALNIYIGGKLWWHHPYEQNSRISVRIFCWLKYSGICVEAMGFLTVSVLLVITLSLPPRLVSLLHDSKTLWQVNESSSPTLFSAHPRLWQTWLYPVIYWKKLCWLLLTILLNAGKGMLGHLKVKHLFLRHISNRAVTAKVLLLSQLCSDIVTSIHPYFAS